MHDHMGNFGTKASICVHTPAVQFTEITKDVCDNFLEGPYCFSSFFQII